MAIFKAKGILVTQLSVLLALVLSSLTVVVLGNKEDNGGIVSWALAPHSHPSLLSPSPSPSPKPHHKGGHHHHNYPHAPPPSATPPTHAPPPHAATSPAHAPPPKAPAPHHHHHNHSHAPPPSATPPAHAPPPKAPAPHHHAPPPHAKPPTTPTPTPPPSPPFQRKAIAVRGLVYCKSCNYRGVDNLNKATPLEGAVVKLACNNTKYHLVEKAKTDKNGFFLIMPKMVTSAGFHKCKVFLVSSPKPECSVFTNYKFGQVGASLIPTPPPPELKTAPYQLFTVGPFAFEPSKKAPCPSL